MEDNKRKEGYKVKDENLKKLELFLKKLEEQKNANSNN
jgi:hypothetical protein